MLKEGKNLISRQQKNIIKYHMILILFDIHKISAKDRENADNAVYTSTAFFTFNNKIHIWHFASSSKPFAICLIEIK